MRKNGVTITFIADGATAADTLPAKAAAWEFLEAAGVEPYAVAEAYFKFEGAIEFDSFGGPAALTDEDCRLAMMWLEVMGRAATVFFGTPDYRNLPNHSYDFQLSRE